MKKLEFRGNVSEVKDRKAKGGFKIALDGEVGGLIPWVGVRVFLYVQSEEEAKEFPIGKMVAITVGDMCCVCHVEPSSERDAMCLSCRKVCGT